MKKIFIILLLIISASLSAQTILTIEGETYTNSETGWWDGVNLRTTTQTILTFRNNSITSVNEEGYLLQCGDDAYDVATAFKLDGATITGNRFTWSGYFDGGTITHGLMMGYNKNYNTKYNYLDGVPYGFCPKGGTVSVTYSSGGISYNIIRNPRIGITVKAVNNISIYNNTFYTTRDIGFPLIQVYSNDVGQNCSNVKIKNNIFWSSYSLPMIKVNVNNTTGFESDYNIFYCDEGSVIFEYEGATKTFAQWQALGYDTHSQVVNPSFINYTALVPVSRLNYGTNLGSAFLTGLSTTAVWTVGQYPGTADQNGTWQVGARIYAAVGAAPVAAFTANTTSITVGQSVTFTDQSTNIPTSWSWNFGDYGTSPSQNPTHQYTVAGNYTVSLTASNAYGSDDEIKTAYITVAPLSGGDIYYVAPAGNDATGSGTIGSPWRTLIKAWTVVAAGDIVYMRGGSYGYTSEQYLTGKNGTANNLIRVFAYPGEIPIVSRGGSYSHTMGCGIFFDGDYVHWKGLEITGFYQQDTDHMWAGMIARDCNYNIFELFNSHHNGHGMRLENNSTGNIVLNGDFHHNYDPITADAYGNADGLEVCYIPAGLTNTVSGCRLYSNSDDGLDLTENAGYLLLENTWAWENGYRENGYTIGGNGNGFKLGANTGNYGATVLRTVRNCLAFHNRTWGYSHNNANGVCHLYNNVAYHNCDNTADAAGFEFVDAESTSILRNNISYANQTNQVILTNCTHDHNTWNGVVTVNDADFVSLSVTGVDGARQADGSLPSLNFLKLVSGSDLIDAGVNVGLYYIGSAPDMGAYEYGIPSTTVPILTTTIITDVTSTTATSGGNITSDGGDAVTARGVCWSTSQNPTTANSKTTNGTGTGSYISYLISLTDGYTYYVRAYATNSVGTGYGNQRSFVAGTPPPPPEGTLVKSGTQFVKIGDLLIKIE